MNRLTARRMASMTELLSDDSSFAYNGHRYWPSPVTSMPGFKVDTPNGSFDTLVEMVHRRHDVISAAVIARGLLLSQLRFVWRSLVSADNGRLWGNADLAPLESPNGTQTRADLLMQAEMHVSYAGNAFFHRVPGTDQVRLLNPSWTSVVLGSRLDPADAAAQRDAEVFAYHYQPGGRRGDEAAGELIDASQVAHWRPEPDPVAWWRGASWVQSVLAEYAVDKAAQAHTQSFFENAATPQMIYTFDPSVTAEQIQGVSAAIDRGHAGAAAGYRSLFLGGGADAKVVGSDLSRIDLRSVTGLAETRIAVRSRVPAVVLGIAEGLGGSALNAGNYNQTRRQWADGWFSPTAQGLCAALGKILPVPPAAELWWDPATVMFVQDDRLDEAQIQQQEAMTIRQLVDAGFDPATVVLAVTTGDFRTLAHSGLYSVQLQPAGAMPPGAPPP